MHPAYELFGMLVRIGPPICGRNMTILVDAIAMVIGGHTISDFSSTKR